MFVFLLSRSNGVATHLYLGQNLVIQSLTRARELVEKYASIEWSGLIPATAFCPNCK